MNYPETLAYLFNRLPMYMRVGASAYRKDLTNTIALCKMTGNPEHRFRSVHIAGTNGKGSTSHILASILYEAGYKTGLYTSPHLKDFRERIRINGKMIPETDVMHFVTQFKDEFEAIEPSFFEWTVALCFHYFAQQQVDVAIVETGLGGRLDSTNVITPLLSVITNIGWDHTDLIGDTLEKIALEKAGIIKEKIPVIIGETHPLTQPVFLQKALEQHAPVFFADQLHPVTDFSAVSTGIRFSIKAGGEQLHSLFCDLGGIYQERNIPAIISALDLLRQSGFQITPEHVRNGFARVKQHTGLMGRWQVIGEKPLTVCDTGHNADGIGYVVKQIAMQQFVQLHIVIGMVKDKDIAQILALLPQDAHYYFCNADIPRALPAAELQQQAAAFGLKGVVKIKVADALSFARQQASPHDMIFVGGSTFVVSEVI